MLYEVLWRNQDAQFTAFVVLFSDAAGTQNCGVDGALNDELAEIWIQVTLANRGIILAFACTDWKKNK